MTKHGRKICMVDDSHIKRIKRNNFNKELGHGKAFFRFYSGANTKQLRHYNVLTDIILIDQMTNPKQLFSTLVRMIS